MEAVSYTHLDVYKRQVLSGSVNVQIIKIVNNKYLVSHLGYIEIMTWVDYTLFKLGLVVFTIKYS